MEFFCTLRPSARTSGGSLPSACATRFWTSTEAMSALRVTSKVTVICEIPELVLEDAMYSIPSTPLRACSSGVVTADSTACAFAPVYTAVTTT